MAPKLLVIEDNWPYDDPDTLAPGIFEMLRRLGVEPGERSVDTARRYLLVEQGLSWADVEQMTSQELFHELRRLCVDRGVDVATVPDEPAPPADHLDDDALLSVSCLAEKFGVPQEPLRKRLERRRKVNKVIWTEDTEATSQSPQYLYRVGSVRPVVEDMKGASGGASDGRPAEKK